MAADLPSVEQLLSILSQATEANSGTPGRSGTLVQLTPELADDVMITGDLHGNRPNFQRIVAAAQLDEHPRRHLVLQEVCHGGPLYCEDGGCMSHLLLEQVAELKAAYPDRVHLLLGNHELAELVDFPIQKNQRMLNLLFRLGVGWAYGPSAEKVRRAYWAFLWSCPLAVRLSNGIFVSHSLPEELDTHPFDIALFNRSLTLPDLDDGGAAFQLVWGRDYRLANAQVFAELVQAQLLVHGHQPCAEGFEIPNRLQIILDCCGPRAAYLLLPLKRPLSHPQIIKRIKLLEE